VISDTAAFAELGRAFARLGSQVTIVEMAARLLVKEEPDAGDLVARHLRDDGVTRAIPWVTFTDPEVGRVGLTEHDARERWGDATTVTSFDYAGLDRAITAGQAYGFAKPIRDPHGRVIARGALAGARVLDRLR